MENSELIRELHALANDLETHIAENIDVESVAKHVANELRKLAEELSAGDQ